MLTPKGQVKILDFGLARLRSEQTAGTGLTQDGAFMGTPDYIAPEQATDARQADIRADVYSLGCTLYFLLAGKPPFEGQTAVQLILQHLEKEPKPLDVPPELAAVVKKMMAKEPGQRYQTLIEVAQALAPFSKPGQKPSAKPAPTPPAESPHSQTANPSDTSKLSTVRKKTAAEKQAGPAPERVSTPAKGERPAASAEEKAAAFEGLDAPTAAPRKEQRQSASSSRSRGNQRWLVLGGVAAAAALGLLVAGVVLMVRLRDGTVVLEIDQPDAEVFVDGTKRDLRVPGGRVPVRLDVPPGRHELKVSKGGFKDFSEEVELDAGGRKSVLVRLESIVPSWDAWLKEVATLPAHKQVYAVAAKLKELNPGFDGNITHKVEGGQVVSLTFGTDHVTDISPVRALPGLKELYCGGTWEGKRQLADLTPLKGMKLTHLHVACSSVRDLSPLMDMKLTFLDFGYSRVDDLSPLKDMKLTKLVFWHVPVTDAGLKHLREMSSLRELAIVGTRLTKDGLVHLENLTDLERLDCGRMKLTGAELVHLKGMSRLQFLSLAETQVTDAGLAHLKGLFSLRVLLLQNARVTDAGLVENLAGLKNLVELDLDGTAATHKGVAALQKALPKCRIRTTLGSAPDNKGFVPLFNGKDLTGWEVRGNNIRWTVKDGILVGNGPGLAGSLVTKRGDFANFHLHVETMLSEGANSGLVSVR